MSTDDRGYAGLCPECHRIIMFATAGCPDAAKEVSLIVKRGYTRERMSVKAARAADWGHVGCSREKRS